MILMPLYFDLLSETSVGDVTLEIAVLLLASSSLAIKKHRGLRAAR